MKLGVRYITAYRYATPVSFSIHEIRLFPRADVFTRVHRLKFETNAGAKVRFGRDVFDNCVATCSFPAPATELRFQLELDLVCRKRTRSISCCGMKSPVCLFPIPPIYVECSRLSGKRR